MTITKETAIELARQANVIAAFPDNITRLCNLAVAHAQKDVEPVAWAMLREDGLVLDVICPEEHPSYEGEYTLPLFTHPAHDDTKQKDVEPVTLKHSDFESRSAQLLQAAWIDGWACCRDSEYIGDEAMNDAFNSCDTLGLCISVDQVHPAHDDTALLRQALAVFEFSSPADENYISATERYEDAQEAVITALRERLGE